MSSNPSPPGGRLPVLVNLSTMERYPLNGPMTTIGRAPDNSLIVPNDGYASGHHAKVYWSQGRWLLEDLNSSNGTTVNDQLITGPYSLSPNDVIKVGRTLFRIE